MCQIGAALVLPVLREGCPQNLDLRDTGSETAELVICAGKDLPQISVLPMLLTEQTWVELSQRGKQCSVV